MRPHCRINGGKNKTCIDWKMKIISDKELNPLIDLLQLPPTHIVSTEWGKKQKQAATVFHANFIQFLLLKRLVFFQL